MRFDFHQDMNVFFMIAILMTERLGKEAATLTAFNNRRVITVSREHTLGIFLVGIANHREQGFGLLLAINDPIGIKDFMPAVF